MRCGKYTYGKIDTHSWGEGAKLEVGNFCSIGDNVKAYLGGNHRIDWVTTFPFGHRNHHPFNKFNGMGHPTTKGDIIIGNDVWIGANAVIMSGVTIGDGAVVANNSHVVKDVESYSLVGGNPAKFIKYRFSEKQRERLLKIKWWDWEDAKINKLLPWLCNDDIDEFIRLAEEM